MYEIQYWLKGWQLWNIGFRWQHMRPFDLFVLKCTLKSHFCLTLSPGFAWRVLTPGKLQSVIAVSHTRQGETSEKEIRKHFSVFFIVYGFGGLGFSSKKETLHVESRVWQAKPLFCFPSHWSLLVIQVAWSNDYHRCTHRHTLRNGKHTSFHHRYTSCWKMTTQNPFGF